jgi:hypothetical protein
MSTTICPGCFAEIEELDGPRHRYIDASPACWDVYTRLMAGDPPIGSSLRRSLLVDAYAVQHPGGDTPQATQSVAVHLVALEAVLGAGMDSGLAIQIRVAAVEVGRQCAGYPRLEPVPESWELTVAAISGRGSPGERGEITDRYVRTVWETWKGLHGSLIEGWHLRTRDHLGYR